MFIKKKDYYELEEFNKFGLKAIYTTKDAGNFKNMEDREKFMKQLNLDENKIFHGFQTHSSNIVIIDENSKNYFEDNDGFLTKMKDAIIFTKYADCLPIFLYDKKNEVFGCLHSGWTGSFNEIGKMGIELLQENFGSKVEDIVVAFGIGISLKNYEVQNEFYEKFKNKFDKKILENVFTEKNNKIYFDNQEFNKNIMLNLGIKKENIITNEHCTFDENFHSHRRDKEISGRNAAFIYYDKVR